MVVSMSEKKFGKLRAGARRLDIGNKPSAVLKCGGVIAMCLGGWVSSFTRRRLRLPHATKHSAEITRRSAGANALLLVILLLCVLTSIPSSSFTWNFWDRLSSSCLTSSTRNIMFERGHVSCSLRGWDKPRIVTAAIGGRDHRCVRTGDRGSGADAGTRRGGGEALVSFYMLLQRLNRDHGGGQHRCCGLCIRDMAGPTNAMPYRRVPARWMSCRCTNGGEPPQHL